MTPDHSALRDIRVGERKLRPGDLITIISGYKTRSLRPEQAAELADGERDELAAAAYARYQAALRSAGAVDFDDLLLLTEELFERFPEARFAEASRYESWVDHFDRVLLEDVGHFPAQEAADAVNAALREQFERWAA